jgi:hypothetical protein
LQIVAQASQGRKLEDIADEFGLTVCRIRQILDADFSTCLLKARRAIEPKACKACGKEFINHNPKNTCSKDCAHRYYGVKKYNLTKERIGFIIDQREKGVRWSDILDEMGETRAMPEYIARNWHLFMTKEEWLKCKKKSGKRAARAVDKVDPAGKRGVFAFFARLLRPIIIRFR